MEQWGEVSHCLGLGEVRGTKLILSFSYGVKSEQAIDRVFLFQCSLSESLLEPNRQMRHMEIKIIDFSKRRMIFNVWFFSSLNSSCQRISCYQEAEIVMDF